MVQSRSYADAIRSRHSPTGEYFPGALPAVVNRRTSAISNISPHRTDSIASAPEVILESPAASIKHSIQSSANLSPESQSSRRPSLTPRRPSIAQVLAKPWSRASYHSDTPSASSFPSDQAITPEYESPVPSRAQQKGKRIKNRRKKSSQTRDHGDFIASRGKGIEIKPRSLSSETPLLAAIAAGDIESVRTLIADKANFPGENLSDNRPLQAAALNGHEDIVKLLVEAGELDINARDSRERTAVFAATSRGHESIVKYLLSQKAKHLSTEESRIANGELKLWRAYEAQTGIHSSPLRQGQTIEGGDITSEPDTDEDSLSLRIPTSNGSNDGDHLYRLEVGSCENIKEMEEVANQRRQEAQEKGEWVKGPIKTPPIPVAQKEVPILQKYTRYPGFGFEVPIVEFDFAENGGHRLVSPSPKLDDLLYGSRGIDSFSNTNAASGRPPCRWYHLPANHLGWAEDLIRKIYEDRSPAEQRKRDVILRREPFAAGDQDHANPTLLDPRPQARSLRPLCRNMTLDRDGTQRLSTAFALHIPYVHWETEISRAEMHHVMEQVRQGRKDDIDDVSLRSIPDIKVIQNHPEWTKNEKLLCAYLYNSPPVHPRRTLDQFYYHMLEDTEERDQDQVITRYYHNVWKRNHHFPEDDEEFKFAMPKSKELEFRFLLNSPSNFEQPDVATQASPTSPAHPQTTVDHPTQDFRSRPDMQRPDSQNGEAEALDERHVIMVDQLWLWILDDNTIITSFPQNWTHDDDGHRDESDPMDVLRSIHRYLTLVNRPPLESIYDLAQLVVYKCLSTFCRKSTPYGPMQILDVYESAIASVTDKETKIFNAFATNSKTKRNNRDPHTPDSKEETEELYNIDEEIEQLKEIKDIQDELHILSVLLENQNSVLKQATQALKNTEQGESGSGSGKSKDNPSGSTNGEGKEMPYSLSNNFHKLYLMVLEQEKRRKSLEVQAELANSALNHLLDLKQKQANVSEARSARWTAESTKQQGNIMVLFTLVTIIFAPLTLIVTIFSLRVVEFPSDLHLKFVLKYMFAISVAVIIPLLSLVVYTTRLTIMKVLERVEVGVVNKRWLNRRKWSYRMKNWKGWWDGLWDGEGQYGGSVGTEMDVAENKKKGWWGRLWKEKSKGGSGCDTEKGEVVDVEEVNGKG